MKKRLYTECRECFLVTSFITFSLVSLTAFSNDKKNKNYVENPAFLNNISSESSYITHETHSDVADYIRLKLGGNVVSDKVDGVVHVNMHWSKRNSSELALKNLEIQEFYSEALSKGELYTGVYLHSFAVTSHSRYYRFSAPITVVT